jgi:Casein kinase II regulatory subunit
MFCEVERSYIEDGFNLYGLRACVSNFSDCLDLILDRIGPDDSDDSHLTQSACTLYGLIHARYIITAHGLDAMYNKVCIVLYCIVFQIRVVMDLLSFVTHSRLMYVSSIVRRAVRRKGIWDMSASTVSGSACFAGRVEGRNGRGHGKNILPQMSVCLPSASHSVTEQ